MKRKHFNYFIDELKVHKCITHSEEVKTHFFLQIYILFFPFTLHFYFIFSIFKLTIAVVFCQTILIYDFLERLFYITIYSNVTLLYLIVKYKIFKNFLFFWGGGGGGGAGMVFFFFLFFFFFGIFFFHY